VDDGVVSNALRKCAPGDTVVLDGPMGYFRIDELTPAVTKYLFIATGSGIAPFHSIVRSYPDLDYTLLHGVRYASDCYDKDVYASDRYIPCISREKGGMFHGRVTDFLREHPVEPGTLCYLCGNCDMLYEAYDTLLHLGILSDHIRTELFYL
jgi:ferredoxin--NADP+ reductase/benzoate/toluate 1,2-dioxygenase reductase subunit